MDLKITLSDQVIYFSQLYGIDLNKELFNLIKQILDNDYNGIVKLKNTKRPLFRKRTQHNTRILFDYGHNWLRIWRIAPRKNVYRNLPDLSNDEGFQNIYDCSLTVALFDENVDTSYSKQSDEIENFDGVRFYNISKIDYLTNIDKFKDFINEEYLYNIQLTPEQNSFISKLGSSTEYIHRIQGAAGSGKTICAVEYAFKNYGKTPILFLIPNEELQGVVVNLLKNKSNNCVYDFIEDSKNISFNEISEVLQTKIVVLTTTQFYEFLSGYNQQIDDQNIKDKIKEDIVKFQPKLKKIGINDIYQIILAFLKNGSIEKQKDNLFNDLQEKIKLVKKEVKLEKYEKLLFDGKSKILFDKIDLVRNIKSKLDKSKLPNILFNTVFILDEVQDLLSEEWQLFFDIHYFNNNDTKLILLGDINQRVTITDFEWGRLTEYAKKHYNKTINGKPIELEYNYRSTKQISAITFYFMEKLYAESYQKKKIRQLPTISNPDKCSYIGDKPWIIVSDLSKLFKGISNFYNEQTNSQNLQIKTDDWFWRWSIITDNNTWKNIAIPKSVNDKVLLFTATASKGIEFETVIIINSIPKNTSEQEIIDITRFYTSLSRAKQNLVLFLEKQQWKLLKDQGFEFNGVHLKIDPDQKVIDNHLIRIGMNRLTEKQIYNAINDMIKTYGDEYIEEKTTLIFSHIQFLLRRSIDLKNPESLIIQLLSKIKNLIDDEKKFSKIIRNTLIPFDNEIKAIVERQLQFMFNSILYWKKSKTFPYAREQAHLTIDELSGNCDDFEIIRSSSLFDYPVKLKTVEDKLPDYFANTFNHIVNLSKDDSSSYNSEILLGSVNELANTCLQSVRSFNKKITI